MSTPNDRLKILLLNDRGPWIVQCLQYDIAAQGESVTKAWEAFNWTYWAQVLIDREKGIDPLSKLEPAPKEYWTRFEHGISFAKQFELRSPFCFADPSVPEDVRLAA